MTTNSTHDAIAAPLEYDAGDFRSHEADGFLAFLLADGSKLTARDGHVFVELDALSPLRYWLAELLCRLRLGAEVYITPVPPAEGEET